jgi:hypothetical protein
MKTAQDRNAEASHLRASIQTLSQQLEAAKTALDNLVDSCLHQWGDPVYDPEYIPGYHIPGDPPGTMGVDRRSPMDVPSKTNERWRRTCKNCGHTEWTTHAKPTGKSPVF